MASSHRVTDFEKNSVRNSIDEVPTPSSVVGPLFISSLLFHLYTERKRLKRHAPNKVRTLLSAWRFSLFFVLFSFYNRLDLIREPAFYWVFYFIFAVYPCLFHHM